MTQDILMLPEELVESDEPSRNQMKQFCLLAKTAHGAAILELVRQVLEAPGIYVFAELLAMPNIHELKNGPDVKYWNTLNLFAYGTYKQYRKQSGDYLELSNSMQKKLKHLTIVSLAIKTKCIPYSVLLEELEIDNVRHLEDVIIEAIYADIIHGKLFQNNRFLEIDYAQGRDIPPGYTSKISQTLQDWVDSCDVILNCIEEQITRANTEKSKCLKNRDRVEQEMINLRKVLRTQISESDETMPLDARETTSSSLESRKKSIKTKSSRPSGKSTAAAAGGGSGGNSGVGATGSATMTTSWFKSFAQSFDKE